MSNRKEKEKKKWEKNPIQFRPKCEEEEEEPPLQWQRFMLPEIVTIDSPALVTSNNQLLTSLEGGRQPPPQKKM